MKLLYILFLATSVLYAQIEIEPIEIPIGSMNMQIKNINGKSIYSSTSGKLLNGKYLISIHQNKEESNEPENDIAHKPFKGSSTGLELAGSFKNGYKNGLWETTYENKLVKTENYNNGLMVGRYRVYNTDGVMLYKTTFGSQGDGKYQDSHYPTGVIKEDGFYKNGVKDGEWCTYDEKGRIVESTIYKDGVIQK